MKVFREIFNRKILETAIEGSQTTTLYYFT